ncbi:phage/plasmid primase, P4 family [Bacteroidota bacterium]
MGSEEDGVEMTMLEHALKTAALGFNVLPVNKDKVPLNHQGCRGASADRDFIKRWWTSRPTAGVAIATGPQPGGWSILVVDVDVKNGAEGPAALAELERQHTPLPATLRNYTPSGGYHDYFRYGSGWDIGNRALCKNGVDIRGDGGYVVVVSPGANYEMNEELDPAAIAVAPDWILKRLHKETRGIDPDTGPREGNALTGTLIRRALWKVKQGEGRNNTGFWLACQLRDDGVSKKDACMLGLAWYVPHVPSVVNGDVYSTKDYEKSVDSAYSGAPRDPWKLNEPEEIPDRNDDIGRGRIFANVNRGGVRYCYPWTTWLEWDGVKWTCDDGFLIARRAKNLIWQMQRGAAAIEDPEKRAAAIKRVSGARMEPRVNAMLNQARSEDGIPVTPDELNQDNYLLNVENGTVDLKTGELLAHDPSDLITKLAPVRYDPEATCGTWQQVLAKIFDGDSELIAYLQRAFGYGMTGDTSEQCIFIMHGSGANGKSTLLETVSKMLGDYATTAATGTFLTKRRNGGETSEDLVALVGARFVSAVEVDEGRALSEALVKRMTGGDRMRARGLYQKSFEFTPTFKILLGTNHKPDIKGTDHAIWRRMHLIPFNVRIPVDEQDKHLGEKLVAELPGILNWCIEGCIEWRKQGLNPPAAVLNATSDYQAEMDVLQGFIDDECEVGHEMVVRAKQMHAAYNKWCGENNEPALTSQKVAARLKERGFDKGRDSNGNYWNGITLRATPLKRVEQGSLAV